MVDVIARDWALLRNHERRERCQKCQQPPGCPTSSFVALKSRMRELSKASRKFRRRMGEPDLCEQRL